MSSIGLQGRPLNQSRFFNHYHPFLPFLDSSCSPDSYFKTSVTLFWSIIVVASRRYREDITLLTALAEWVTRLLWTSISTPPYAISTVQSIIVLCIWPLPTTSTWKDPSLTPSSTATSTAMQIGLHRPLHAQDFMPESNILSAQPHY